MLLVLDPMLLYVVTVAIVELELYDDDVKEAEGIVFENVRTGENMLFVFPETMDVIVLIPSLYATPALDTL